MKWFNLKQVIIQLSAYPRHAILTLLTLIFSILIMMISFTYAKETEGIWEKGSDYYLSSQELYGFEVKDGQTILNEQALSFSPQRVKEIEQLPGIKVIDKEPAMIDVHPLISTKLLTPAISRWIGNQDQELQYETDDFILLPNVSYIIADQDEFAEEGAVMLYMPNASQEELNQLPGESIQFLRKYRNKETNSVKSVKWKLTIAETVNQPYRKKAGDIIIEREEPTFVISEETSKKLHLYEGYQDLTIYTDENLTMTASKEIYEKVYALSAGISGSFFQYIPEWDYNETRIADYLSSMGQLTFAFSIFFTLTALGIMVFGKYQLQRRQWGIYRSLGMPTGKIVLYLNFEVLFLFGMAAGISTILYIVFYQFTNTEFPFSYYLTVLAGVLLMVFLLVLLIPLILVSIIKKDSVSSLLRIEE